MKTPESTFPGGLLNREEISFLLRPADKSGLKTLAETAAETLAENDEPKGKNAAFVPLPLCLQLDIRGRKTKIFLSFGCKETPPENNRRMDGAERLRQPLAVRRLNDGTVVLTARMPPFSLPAKEIIQWKKGGWIPLPFMPADPVLLSAEGMPALKAVVGRKGSRIAVKLINKVK